MSITVLQASAQLLSLIEQVNENLKPVIIQSKAGNAVLISQSEYISMIETTDLLSTAVNRDWLLESLAQADRGELIPLELPVQLVKSSPNAAKKVLNLKRFRQCSCFDQSVQLGGQALHRKLECRDGCD